MSLSTFYEDDMSEIIENNRREIDRHNSNTTAIWVNNQIRNSHPQSLESLITLMQEAIKYQIRLHSERKRDIIDKGKKWIELIKRIYNGNNHGLLITSMSNNILWNINHDIDNQDFFKELNRNMEEKIRILHEANKSLCDNIFK